MTEISVSKVRELIKSKTEKRASQNAAEELREQLIEETDKKVHSAIEKADSQDLETVRAEHF